jgi:hypothetical protein
MEIAHGAGAVSPLGYASASVVELGGTVGFTHASKTTEVHFTPSIGYFLVDNFYGGTSGGLEAGFTVMW